MLFLYRRTGFTFIRILRPFFENNPELYIRDRLEDYDPDENHYYIAERPKVYKRAGDSRIYDEKLIEIRSDGIYRSLHYIIKLRDIMWRSRDELCLKRAGVKWITILFILTIKTM